MTEDLVYNVLNSSGCTSENVIPRLLQAAKPSFDGRRLDYDVTTAVDSSLITTLKFIPHKVAVFSRMNDAEKQIPVHKKAVKDMLAVFGITPVETPQALVFNGSEILEWAKPVIHAEPDERRSTYETMLEVIHTPEPQQSREPPRFTSEKQPSGWKVRAVKGDADDKANGVAGRIVRAPADPLPRPPAGPRLVRD